MLKPAEVRATLQKSAHIEVSESEDPPVSPISIVGGENVVIGALRSADGPSDSFWLWLAWDNLTRGSASNIVEIAESVMLVESN
jgi:aspartate-semialdehyde dehydrogenase